MEYQLGDLLRVKSEVFTEEWEKEVRNEKLFPQMTPKENWEVWAGELYAGKGGKDSQVRKVGWKVIWQDLF